MDFWFIVKKGSPKIEYDKWSVKKYNEKWMCLYQSYIFSLRTSARTLWALLGLIILRKTMQIYWFYLSLETTTKASDKDSASFWFFDKLSSLNCNLAEMSFNSWAILSDWSSNKAFLIFSSLNSLCWISCCIALALKRSEFWLWVTSWG